MEPKLVAKANLHNLSVNAYPGRGLIVGRAETGEIAMVYWIMGRSPNSRNRVFVAQGGKVSTEFADPSKGGDPALVIYNAMLEYPHDGFYAVSNGAQTDAIIGRGSEVLLEWEYEPDAPNFTPRISATVSMSIKLSVVLTLLRKSPWGEACERHFYRYSHLEPGYGHCLTTYAGDSALALPAFRGEPLLVPLEGAIDEVASAYWEALNEENRVSLAVKFVGARGKSRVRLINRYEKILA